MRALNFYSSVYHANLLTREKCCTRSAAPSDFCLAVGSRTGLPLSDNVRGGTCQVVLANPRNVKNVLGSKTDFCSAEWLAESLGHGLIRGSFIPPKPIRDLREVVGYPKALIRESSSVVNRLCHYGHPPERGKGSQAGRGTLKTG